MNKTIVYITANVVSSALTEIVQREMLKTGFPIISVSQKPMKFGENICVGDVGRSGFNIHRQIAIGCKRAKTKYVYWCEDDTLYPPEHFAFTPPKDDRVYINKNMWRFLAYKVRKCRYAKKERSTICTTVSNRMHLLNSINKMMKRLPEWSEEKDKRLIAKEYKINGVSKHGLEYFETKVPVVSIYHKDGMHSRLSKLSKDKILDISYWPQANVLAKKLGRRR